MTCQFTFMRPNFIVVLGFAAAIPAAAQRPALTRADSALVGRILLAEDRRDSTSAAIAEGRRNSNAIVQTLARRAAYRISDTMFVARDSLPSLPRPTAYPDAGWRARLRRLAADSANCGAMRTALADSAWPVRLVAADRVGTSCGADESLVGTLAGWITSAPTNAQRSRGGVSWHGAAHAITALARIAPARARALLPAVASSPVPWLRTYAVRAAARLSDTATVKRLARDQNDNVKEAAIDALSRVAGHAADDEYVAALSARGYQAVRAGARALRGSPRGAALVEPLMAAFARITRDSSETSRDARVALIERAGEFATAGRGVPATTSVDFDCAVAQASATAAAKTAAPNVRIGARCNRLAIQLPQDAVALALGRDVRLRVVLADSSGGGSFTVRLRGDVAPLMAARVLALARAGYYNGRTWHRVEPNFVIQGGGGASEYVGHPRFIRDEVGTVPHLRGTVGMSTRGHDTGDAQWFVNLVDNNRLNPLYTVFAEVVEGIDVVDGVLEGDVIQRIEVL
jgi:cyclophilin family peptidyl-prolyl cis-trans isomerase